MLHESGEAGIAAGIGGRALLAIGIDNLGVLEELFGEALGDEVVAALGRRLAAVAPREAGFCATRHRRFLLDLPVGGNCCGTRGGGGTGAERMAAIFARLQEAAAAEAIETASGPVAVTLSGGCAFPEPGRHAGREMLELAALQALHTAMARSVGSFEVAQGERGLLEYRARLLDASRAAVSAAGTDQLTVAFQPVVHAAGGLSISFHECLVRLRQPDGGLLTAGSFMPALERLGLAPLIDRQVLGMTFATLARHQSARLSINIFPQTMQDARWMALFEQETARDPTLAERLIVELTETTSVLDPRRTLAFMDRLRRHGVAFALDDFGAGHTSLHYLRDFRFDILKIDGRFVRGIELGSDDAFFVGTVVDIARRFDMMTVAEAVQGPAEARCLSELGIEYFQGFHFGSPSLLLEPTHSPMPGVAAQA